MKKIITNLLSFMYSIFIIIGISFMIKGNFSFLTNSFLNIFFTIIVFIILFIFFRLLIIFLNKYLDNYKKKKTSPPNKLLLMFDKHPLIFSMIVLLIFWLPYIIAYYPGILNKDNVFQVKQYFGIDNKYSYYVNLIDKNQIITNHHPYLHTILLGTCVKIGLKLHNANFGFFLFTSIQLVTFLFTLSYSIYYLKKKNINYQQRLALLLIYSLVPFFPFYAITLVKDSLYTCYFLLYIILLHSLLQEELDLKKAIQIIIIAILLFLIRNNGIYTFILSFPFLLIKNKKWPKYLVVILLVFGSYKIYNNIILPSLKVTPTSIRETLSIPFQQTARYIKYHEKDISKNDKKQINKILKYNVIKKKYNPELSDPVKATFNKDYTKEDLTNYFKVWMKGFFKHPITYLEATINNTYGYLCPLKTNWYIYYKYRDELKEQDKIDYHYNELEKSRYVLSGYGVVFQFIPVIGLLVNIGFNSWILLYLLYYLFINRRYKEITILLPSLVSLLVCFASPANTYFRYALPYVASAPLLIYLIINNINTKIKKG